MPRPEGEPRHAETTNGNQAEMRDTMVTYDVNLSLAGLSEQEIAGLTFYKTRGNPTSGGEPTKEFVFLDAANPRAREIGKDTKLGVTKLETVTPARSTGKAFGPYDGTTQMYQEPTHNVDEAKAGFVKWLKKHDRLTPRVDEPTVVFDAKTQTPAANPAEGPKPV